MSSSSSSSCFRLLPAYNAQYLMLLLRSLPCYDPLPQQHSVAEAAFVVGGGRSCLLMECIAPAAHVVGLEDNDGPEYNYSGCDDCGDVVDAGLDSARSNNSDDNDAGGRLTNYFPQQLNALFHHVQSLYNHSLYAEALSELDNVKKLWSSRHIWYYLHRFPHATLQDALDEHSKRLERIARREERERRRVEQLRLLQQASEEESSKQECAPAATAEHSDAESDYDSDDEERAHKHEQQQQQQQQQHQDNLQEEEDDEPELPIVMPIITQQQQLAFTCYYHTLHAAILLSQQRYDAALEAAMRSVRAREEFVAKRVQEEEMNAMELAKKNKKENEDEEELDRVSTNAAAPPPPPSLSNQLQHCKLNDLFIFDASSKSDDEKQQHDSFWGGSMLTLPDPVPSSTSSPPPAITLLMSSYGLQPFLFPCPADAITYSQIGAALLHMGNTMLALRSFHVSLIIRLLTLRAEDTQYVDVATSLNNVGVALTHLNQWELAHTHFEAAAEIVAKRLDRAHPRKNTIVNNMEKIKTRRLNLHTPALLLQLQAITEAKVKKEIEAAEKRAAKLKKNPKAETARTQRTARGKKDDEKPKEFHEDSRFFSGTVVLPPPAPVAPGVSAADVKVPLLNTMPLRHWEVQMGQMQQMMLEFGAKKKKAAGGGKGKKGKSGKKKK